MLIYLMESYIVYVWAALHQKLGWNKTAQTDAEKLERWRKHRKKNTLGFHGFNIFLRFQLKKDMDVLFPSVGWLIEGFEQTPLTTGKWL